MSIKIVHHIKADINTGIVTDSLIGYINKGNFTGVQAAYDGSVKEVLIYKNQPIPTQKGYEGESFRGLVHTFDRFSWVPYGTLMKALGELLVLEDGVARYTVNVSELSTVPAEILAKVGKSV